MDIAGSVLTVCFEGLLHTVIAECDRLQRESEEAKASFWEDAEEGGGGGISKLS